MVNLINDNIARIRERMEAAAKKSRRDVKEVRLMGVSKFHTLERMLEASYGVDILGENRVKEAADKRLGWPSDNKREWHLIGHLQRNKARRALEVFDLIETVDSLDLARMLNRILEEMNVPRYPVYIEVNMSQETSKEGVRQQEADNLIDMMLKYCPSLSVDGLMTIGPNTEEEGAVRRAFSGLRELRDDLRGIYGLPLTELSMGMSGDYEIAIEEGSTIVRVGTAIFGGRE